MSLPSRCFLAAALFLLTAAPARAEEITDDAAATQKVLAAAKAVKHVDSTAPGTTTPVASAPATTAITTVTTTNLCGEVGSMDRMLMKQRKLAFLATSIDKAEAVHIYFISHATGDWAEMIMDDKLNACIVNEGTDWHFIVGN